MKSRNATIIIFKAARNANKRAARLPRIKMALGIFSLKIDNYKKICYNIYIEGDKDE